MKYIKTKLFYFLLIAGFSFVPTESSAQMKVSGKVIDAEGQPLSGVTIKIKNTQRGTISAVNGNFVVAVEKETDLLVFTYIGFKTREILANSVTIKNVQLEVQEANTLDQVVVIGYGVSRLGDITGSISSVKGETLTQTGVSSFTEALQGRIAGVKINSQSGEPGGGISMQIRGANSVTASSSPLFVIDGMQIDVNDGEVASSSVGGYTTYNPLSTLNPMIYNL